MRSIQACEKGGDLFDVCCDVSDDQLSCFSGNFDKRPCEIIGRMIPAIELTLAFLILKTLVTSAALPALEFGKIGRDNRRYLVDFMLVCDEHIASCSSRIRSCMRST